MPAAFAAAYGELRAEAERLLAAERLDHTLEPSALVHEVFLRLVATDRAQWNDRAHFQSLGVKVMRQVLVDHARRKKARKRAATRITLSEAIAANSDDRVVDVVALDDALAELEAIDPVAAQILELRLLAAMTVRETAAAVALPYDRVKDEWLHARAWLRRKLAR